VNQVLGLLYVAVIVLFIAASWRILSKGGKPGWASLIPIYNLVALLQVSGRSGWWILGMFVPFLNFFVAIRLPFDLAKSFGRGIGFGFGLLFLGFIFWPLLAFGDSTHIRSRELTAAAAA
jgi:hypothetical protein